MTREEKTQQIEELHGMLAATPHFYLTDISALTAEKTSKLRRMCFDKKIRMQVVKNSLLKKAIEKSTGRDYKDLMGAPLQGSTAVLLCDSGSDPAKLIKEFRKTNDRPILKAAFVEETVYVGDSSLDALASIKSKNELLGDIIGLLQSPAKNVVSALQSPGRKLAGIVKTLSEKPE